MPQLVKHHTCTLSNEEYMYSLIELRLINYMNFGSQSREKSHILDRFVEIDRYIFLISKHLYLRASDK